MPVHVTIGGSYRKHFGRIARAADEFRAAGAQVLRPATSDIVSADDELVRLAGDPEDAIGVELAQFDAIANSTLLYVVNPGGYVGPSAIAQAGLAYGAGVTVVCSEPPFERAMQAVSAGVGAPETALKLLAGHTS
jgi:hypothetical protein